VAVVAALCTASPSGDGGTPPGNWTVAPAYLPLFAPAGARSAAYRVYVSPAPLDAVLAQLTAEPSLLRPPGAWTSTALLPLDAFGQTGGYDRARLARLYGSQRARVARGPRGAGSRPIENWTLISPYPTPDMTRLQPGTMLIVLNVEFP
jgi:hypothetical protein